MRNRRPWQEELAIVDRTMKAISGISDPEAMVTAYWENISDLIRIDNYVAVSRRDVEPPYYLVTRSSRFEEEFNPWTQRDRLPKLKGGLLGEILYANEPSVIGDLPSRLAPDDPGRFYMEGFGALVASPQYDNGESLNVTAVLLPSIDAIDPAMIPMLHWQSGLFGRGTTNLVLRNQLAATLSILDRELQAVGEIQRSLLPETLPSIPGFELAAHYKTSARAGGDYYDFFPLGEGKWGVFIADVSGHGTPAAVLMAITHAIAHAQPGIHTPPATMLERLNEQLTRSYTRGGTFITAFYAVLDPANRTLAYSRAGHNPPRLSRGKQIIPLDGAGALPLGIVQPQSFAQETVALEHGDLLLLYTDGITEAFAPPVHDRPRELFGVTRLDAVLQRLCAEPPGQCLNQIREELAKFTANAAPTDDQTLLAMRVR